MQHITLALRLPTKSLEQCMHLLAGDIDLFAVTRRYGGWLLPHAGEKGLVARVHALLAERAICLVLDPGYCPPPLPLASGSTLILKIQLSGGADRQLCAVFDRYEVRRTSDRPPAGAAIARVFLENPELLTRINAQQNQPKAQAC